MTAHKSVPHEQAMELLPWLINDSLNNDERATVLAHSQSCVICRREMETLEDLRDSIERLFGTVSIPTPDMRKINSRIDKHISRQNFGRRAFAWLGELFRSPWRAAYAAQTVLLVVLAAGKQQGLNWGGVDIDGYLVWIFVGVAHLYFTIMWWSSFGFQGWFPWNDGWRGTFRLRPRKELIRRFMNQGPFTMIAVVIGFSIIIYQLGKIMWGWFWPCN